MTERNWQNLVTLLSIVDDPGGKLIRPLKNIGVLQWTILKEDFLNNSFVVSTLETSEELVNLLDDFGIYVTDYPQNGMAQARRDAIEFALDMSNEGPFFYCDLDRLIFWMHHYPDELQETIKKADEYDYCVIGRTEQAFNTHPYLQRETERIMNDFVFMDSEFPEMDMFAGARIFSLKVARFLLPESRAEKAGIDYEWPLIAWRSGFEISYCEVNGLAYESEFLGIVKSDEDEIRLRIENIKSLFEV